MKVTMMAPSSLWSGTAAAAAAAASPLQRSSSSQDSSSPEHSSSSNKMSAASPTFASTPAAAPTGEDETQNHHQRTGGRLLQRKSSVRRHLSLTTGNWHVAIGDAIRTQKWEHLRGQLALLVSYDAPSAECPPASPRRRRHHHPEETSQQQQRESSSMWGRLAQKVMGASVSPFETTTTAAPSSEGLLAQDDQGCTPLHVALRATGKNGVILVPNDVLLDLLRVAPHVAAVPAKNASWPLHLAVAHAHHMEVIAELVEAHPAALGALNRDGHSPLRIALELAKQATPIKQAPRSFWMPVVDNHGGNATAATIPASAWQEQQAERWGAVHWLLLSSATHPHTQLSVLGSHGRQQPMLVEALLYAAPPAVISLLIGASVLLLRHNENAHASAFAGSTLYACITRHYPLTILISMCSQCHVSVARIRDETGMGLVAAQFICGLLVPPNGTKTGEWQVHADFWTFVHETLEDGTLATTNAAFVDWWKKIQYLLIFAAGLDDTSAYLKGYLLHAALRNADVPPLVIQMLLKLYPEASGAADPTNGALPLHLACQCRGDYLARSYELPLLGEDSIIELVRQTYPAAVAVPWHNRLPLCHALTDGKTFAAIEGLVSDNVRQLGRRDAATNLYPALLAASYIDSESEEARFRRSCKARNKYSHAVWRGLSKKQIEQAEEQVRQTEDLERLWTVWELLRLYPRICPVSSDTWSFVDTNISIDAPFTHYTRWAYDKTPNGEFVVCEDRMHELQEVTVRGRPAGTDIGTLPISASNEFGAWWAELKVLLREQFPGKYVDDSNGIDELDTRAVMLPRYDDRFLLHASLANSNVPPQLVALVLKLYPDSITLPTPNKLFPLDIAARTPAYTPRHFEPTHASALSLTLSAKPDSATTTSCDRPCPLHQAIRARKSWSDILCLVKNGETMLVVRETTTCLCAFQLAALRHLYSAEDHRRFRAMARNAVDPPTWNEMSPSMQLNATLEMQRAHQLERLSLCFILLRTYPAAAAKAVCTQETTNKAPCESDQPLAIISEVPGATQSISSDENEDTEHDYSTAGDDKFDELPYSKSSAPARQSALMKLLSQYTRDEDDNNNVFDCDASVFSTVDVMSAISAVENKAPPSKPAVYRNMNDFDGSDSDALAEDSMIFDSTGSRASETETHRTDESAPFAFVDHTEATDASSLGLFQLRRKPHSDSRRENSPYRGAQLSKAVDHNNGTLAAQLETDRMHHSDSTLLSLQSIQTGTTLSSIAPLDLEKDNPGHMWVSDKVDLLGSLNRSKDMQPHDDELLFDNSNLNRAPRRQRPWNDDTILHRSTSTFTTSQLKSTPIPDSAAMESQVLFLESSDSSKLSHCGDGMCTIAAEEQGVGESDNLRSREAHPLARKATDVPNPAFASNVTLNDLQSEMYFDTKALRWKQRPSIRENAGFASENSIVGKSEEVNPSSARAVAKGKENGSTAPFADFMPSKRLLDKNKSFAKAAHASRYTGKSTKATSLTPEGPVRHDPSLKSIRTRWADMFRSSDEKLSCLICNGHKREVLMIPCRHLALCRRCHVGTTDIERCPLCNEVSTDRILIF